jgi:uncharacterized damage-inducible protein DinB
MFQHHTWATLTLIDHCRSLSPEQLLAVVPGTRGTIQETLVHLVAADGRYQAGMTGERPEPSASERQDPPPTLDELEAIFRAQAERWAQLLDRAGTLKFVIAAAPEEGWPEVHDADDLLFLQAIHHGNDHRTHICTVFGALGLEAPELDGWHYWMAERV